MKSSVFDLPIPHRFLLVLVNALLAMGLTVLSFSYKQPKDCNRFCGGEQMPCPTGSCRYGQQTAGWPIPAFIDDPGGGSPTSGWGIIGPEDPPLGVPIILDVLFYSVLVWLAMYIIELLLGQLPDPKMILVALPVNTLLALCLWFFYYLFGYMVGFDIVGRGHAGL